MAKRGEALELAVLGLLHDSPMHGYELRKQLSTLLGWSRVLSYGSLYPCLQQMLRVGCIAQDTTASQPAGSGAMTGRRARIVYRLTEQGEERFKALVADAGPSTWDDDSFGVHFAFFSRTDAETRLRILEGRRNRLEERLDRVRTAMARTRARVDAYTIELQRHGLESTEREVRWLSQVIDNERARPARSQPSNRNE